MKRKTKHKTLPHEHLELKHEFAEGRRAFFAGQGQCDCPYPAEDTGGFNDQRHWWMCGWLDARSQTVFEEMESYAT